MALFGARSFRRASADPDVAGEPRGSVAILRRLGGSPSAALAPAEIFYRGVNARKG